MNELFLGGCTFKAAQQARFPEVPPTPQSADWASRGDAARIDVHSLLQQPWNCLDDPFETLEAIAAEAPVITNANFSITVKGLLRKYDISVDILVKIASGYFPVAISNHWVAREKRGAQRRGFFTRNLGTSDGWVGEYSVRHHPQDSYRLALAALGLRDAGVHVPFGGVIGQDRERCFVEDIDYCLGVLGRRVALVAPELNAIDSATPAELAAHNSLSETSARAPRPLPPTGTLIRRVAGIPREFPTATLEAVGPRRIKDCANCRYWFDCERQLVAADDISLFRSGDKGQDLRNRGVITVEALINDAADTRAATLARTWREGIAACRTTPTVTAPRFDVEIDIDMEAYLHHGAYLWGTFDGQTYRPFATWEPLGGPEEAANFAAFWQWLSNTRTQAHEDNKTFAAFCYANHGENHWLKESARRFHGQYPGIDVPSEKEVQAFISSTEWIDVFQLVKSQLIGPGGLGLKKLAPMAGFHWQEEDLDGEASIRAYEEGKKEELLSYNGDDCRATRAIRRWLADSAPGTMLLQ